jgi:hypothetical protein
VGRNRQGAKAADLHCRSPDSESVTLATHAEPALAHVVSIDMDEMTMALANMDEMTMKQSPNDA